MLIVRVRMHSIYIVWIGFLFLFLANCNRAFADGLIITNPGLAFGDGFVVPIPKKGSGLFFGDTVHILGWPDEQLMYLLGDLKKSEVDVMFWEWFCSSEQELLDAYFAEPTSENLEKIKKNRKIFGPAETALLRKSVDLGIRPVGIELCPHDGRLDTRDDHWVKMIQAYLKDHPGTTWIGFVGLTHLEGGGFPGMKDYVGVNERLDVPSVHPEKLKEAMRPPFPSPFGPATPTNNPQTSKLNGIFLPDPRSSVRPGILQRRRETPLQIDRHQKW